MSLSQYRKMLDTRQIGAPELLEEFIKKIQEKDDLIKSFITLDFEGARAAAKAAQVIIDSGSSLAMTGIPYSAKDNILTSNIRTTCASKMLENYRPPYDATVIERLNAQNAVLLGKNNLDEFAMGGSGTSSYFGTTRNPANTERIAGGSSSGSAAAVAAGFTPISLGTDTGGSVRLPAAFCGVCGLKPTYGRISRYGVIEFASSLDQVGIIAETAEDTGYLLNATVGHDSRDATSSVNPCDDFTAFDIDFKKLKIGVVKELSHLGIDSEIAHAVENALSVYRHMGAEITEVSFPSLKYAVAAYYILSSAEAASNLARFDGIKYGLRSDGDNYAELIKNTRADGFGKKVKRRILFGNYVLSDGNCGEYYQKALAVRRKIKEEYMRAFESCDILITPTAPTAAYRINNSDADIVKMCMEDICTVPASLAGLPAISIPCGYTKDSLPIGMSITGKPFAEAEIIAAAMGYESEVRK